MLDNAKIAMYLHSDMASTPHAKTVDALLRAQGETLEAFITYRRDLGVSYNRIAKALAVLTDGIVDVTGETIRNWSTTNQRKAS